MVLSVLIPRFELLAACSADWRALRTPAALAPVPGGPGRVGQVSSAAESYGVKTGMRLGEALSRCPDLNLIPPDPALAARLGEEILLRLEQIGAAVEPGRPGEAFLETEGLHGLYGGRDGTVARVRGALASQRAIAAALRLAVAPGRFTARLAAALERPVVTAAEAADFLAPLPVTNLDLDPGLDYELIRNFERLGFTTLGELAALPTEAVADRSDGYPFFVQVWAFHTWNVATHDPISAADVDAATAAARVALDESFFAARIARIPESEVAYVRGLASLGPGPHRSGDIAACLGRKVESRALGARRRARSGGSAPPNSSAREPPLDMVGN